MSRGFLVERTIWMNTYLYLQTHLLKQDYTLKLDSFRGLKHDVGGQSLKLINRFRYYEYKS